MYASRAEDFLYVQTQITIAFLQFPADCASKSILTIKSKFGKNMDKVQWLF